MEQEKDEAIRLFELSRQKISQLEEENNDLKNPLKPHLIKLDMQTKQVNLFYLCKDYLSISFKQAQEEHARAEVELIQEINIIREELT